MQRDLIFAMWLGTELPRENIEFYRLYILQALEEIYVNAFCWSRKLFLFYLLLSVCLKNTRPIENDVFYATTLNNRAKKRKNKKKKTEQVKRKRKIRSRTQIHACRHAHRLHQEMFLQKQKGEGKSLSEGFL